MVNPITRAELGKMHPGARSRAWSHLAVVARHVRLVAQVGGVLWLAACSAAAAPGSGPPNPGRGSGSDAGTGVVRDAATGVVNPSGQGAPCTTVGMTRGCCRNGTQQCMGDGEFAMWGPCLDSSGGAADCSSPGGCAAGEFGPMCDAGTPPPPADAGCGPGEFGQGCDSGLPPPPMLCTDRTVNTEPGILAGYSPADGQSVPLSGLIQIWVTDECPAFVAPMEQVDSATGLVTTPGDLTATASDGYLDEPALYIAPSTAESGGTPHFPRYIKGSYNNQPSNPFACGPFAAPPTAAPVDPPPPGSSPLCTGDPLGCYNTQFIWRVSDLGLPTGTYRAEFVIHDGDSDRAIGCITFTITR